MWRMVSQLATLHVVLVCGGLLWFIILKDYIGVASVVGQQHKCEQDLDNRAQL
jgi:hypothetical protein